MWNTAPKEARKLLLGVMLIKLATGLVAMWGSINIYFFSALRAQGETITKETNSMLMLSALIPASAFALVATKLISVLGHRRLIVACSLLFLFSPIFINFKLTLFTLGFFILFLPTVSFAISSIAIMDCLWGHFPAYRNKATSVAVFFFSVGSIVGNIAMMTLLNPHNLPTNTDPDGVVYFGDEVNSRLLFGCNITYPIAGVMFFIGSLFIRPKLSVTSLLSQLPANPQFPVNNIPLLPLKNDILFVSKETVIFKNKDSISIAIKKSVDNLNQKTQIFSSDINEDKNLALQKDQQNIFFKNTKPQIFQQKQSSSAQSSDQRISQQTDNVNLTIIDQKMQQKLSQQQFTSKQTSLQGMEQLMNANFCSNLVQKNQIAKKQTNKSSPIQLLQIKIKNKQSESEAQIQTPKNKELTQILPRSVVLKSLLDPKFVIIFVTSMFMSLYSIYLSTNMKLIYMPLLKDDHFIAFCALASSLASTLGVPVWGCVADTYGFRKSFLLIASLDIIIKFLGVFATQKAAVFALFVGLGLIDKAFFTIGGPGLADIFGHHLAVDLLPYKGLSLFFAFILVPLIQLLFISFISNHSLLIIYFIFSSISVPLALIFYKRYPTYGNNSTKTIIVQ